MTRTWRRSASGRSSTTRSPAPSGCTTATAGAWPRPAPTTTFPSSWTPRRSLASRCGRRAPRTTFEGIGLINHSSRRHLLAWMRKDAWPKNPDGILTILHEHLLDYLQHSGRKPRTLFLQFDNAAGENKNHTSSSSRTCWSSSATSSRCRSASSCPATPTRTSTLLWRRQGPHALPGGRLAP